MPNYYNAKIYGVYDNSTDELLSVGATVTDYLSTRKGTLFKKERIEKTKDKPLTIKMVELGKDKVDIRLIENCKCQNKEELENRKNYFTNEMNPTFGSDGDYLDKRNNYEMNSEYSKDNENEEALSDKATVDSEFHHSVTSIGEIDILRERIEELELMVDILTKGDSHLREVVEYSAKRIKTLE
jgi:hypothetical protein